MTTNTPAVPLGQPLARVPERERMHYAPLGRLPAPQP